MAGRPIRIDVFDLAGTPYECGRQLAEGYRRTRGDARARRPQGAKRIRRFDIADAERTLRTFAPTVWEELHGIADGLETGFAEAVAAFSNGRLAYPGRGCSSAIGGGLLGRNYDFAPRHYDRALVAMRAKGAYASVGFADRYTGRLDGMNEHGLCIALHAVNEAVVQPGIVCILVVRIVLDQCATTAEAVALLERLPHGIAFNYSLIDRTGDAAVVEAAPGRVGVRRGAPLGCANHFLLEEMRPLNRKGIAGSQRRLPAVTAIAKAGGDAATLFRALNGSDSPAFDHRYSLGSGTLHTIVCDPAGTMLVGAGADATPVRLDVAAWAKGAALGVDRMAGRLGDREGKMILDRDLSGVTFRNLNLSGARFDDINFAGAEIGSYCNFRGMTIAGVPVEELFAAWKRQKG